MNVAHWWYIVYVLTHHYSQSSSVVALPKSRQRTDKQTQKGGHQHTTSAAKLNERQANEPTNELGGIRCDGMYYSLPHPVLCALHPLFCESECWRLVVCLHSPNVLRVLLLASGTRYVPYKRNRRAAWHKQACQPSHPTRGTVFRH